MAHDAFISYSSKDKPIADAVCATLERRGLRCWMAPRDVLPGDEWAGAIINAISACRVMVLVFSANANQSHQIPKEIERAVHKGIPVIPVRIENVEPSKSLEYFISTPHWMDAITPPLERHIEHLADTIKKLLGDAAPSAPPAPLTAVPASSGRRWRWLAAPAGVALLAAAIYLPLRPSRPAGPPPALETAAQLIKSGNFADAVDALTAEIARKESAAAYRTRAAALTELGRWRDAVADADRAIELDPRDPLAWAARGFARSASGQIGMAKEMMRDAAQALSFDDKCPLALVVRSTAFLFDSDFDNALSAAKKAVELAPDFSLAHVALSAAQDAKGESSAQAADTAISLAPTSPWGYLVRAHSLLGSEPERAIADATRAASIAPYSALALAHRAGIHISRGDLANAESDAAAAVNLDPTNDAAWATRGLARILDGRYTDASGDADEAIRLNPDSMEGFAVRAMALANLKQPEPAMAAADRAIALAPNSWIAYLARATAHALAGSREKFLADCAAVERLGPDSILVPLLRGVFFSTHDQHADAAAAFTDALRIAPQSTQAIYGLAEANFNLGKYDEAIAGFTEAIKAAPTAEDAYYWRARSYEKTSRIPEALADLDAAIRLDPTDVDNVKRRQSIREQSGDLAGAIDDLATLSKLEPQDQTHDGSRLRLLMDLGRFDEAIALADKAFPRQTEKAETYFVHGVVLARAGKTEPAIADFDAALLAAQNWPVALQHRALAHLAAGHTKEALNDVDAMVLASPHDLDVVLLRGAIRLYAGDHAAAVRDIDQYVAARPDIAVGYSTRGSCKLQTGDTTGALADAEHALKLSPGDSIALRLRAQIRLLSGRQAEAMTDLDAAMKSTPRDADALCFHGSVQRLMGNATGAWSDAKLALIYQPGSSRAYVLLAALDEDAGRLTDAETNLANARRLNPSSFRAGPLTVTAVHHGGQAERLAIRPGDVLLSLDAAALTCEADVRFFGRPARRARELIIQRGPQRLTLAVDPGMLGVECSVPKEQ